MDDDEIVTLGGSVTTQRRNWFKDNFNTIFGLSRVVWVYGCLFYGLYLITTANMPTWASRVVWGAWLIVLSYLSSENKR